MRIYDPIRGRDAGKRTRETPKEAAVADNSALADPKSAGTELFDTSEKVFEDIKAEPGDSAFTFMHTVSYEGSVGLVNLLKTTRFCWNGFDTSLVLCGPGVLMASGTRVF